MEYFKVVERTESGDYLAHIPELPGCAARGDTPEEAHENLATALDNYLESLRLRAQFDAMLDVA